MSKNEIKEITEKNELQTIRVKLLQNEKDYIAGLTYDVPEADAVKLLDSSKALRM